jgi:hypothetical protein
MNQADLQKAIAEGQTNNIQQPEQAPPQMAEFDDMAKMIPIFDMLRKPKYHLTATPTFKPKTFLEQIQFYDDATNRRLYLYINGTWRYVTLT